MIALSMENGLRFNKSMYFSIFILILVAFALFRFSIMPYARKLEKKLESKKPTLKEELKKELESKKPKIVEEIEPIDDFGTANEPRLYQ